MTTMNSSNSIIAHDLWVRTVIDVEYATVVVDTLLPSRLLTHEPHTPILIHKQQLLLQRSRKFVSGTARN